MKLELLERRTKTLNYLSKGVKPVNIIRDFSKEYDVSEQAIRKDIRRLSQWAPQILQLQDDGLAFELANNIKQVIPNAWAEYHKADNSNARIGALRVVMDATMKLIDVLQSLGKLEKMAEVRDYTLRWINDESDPKDKVSASQRAAKLSRSQSEV